MSPIQGLHSVSHRAALKTALRLLVITVALVLFSCDLGEFPIGFHNRILFTSSRSGLEQLYMVNPDGSDLRQLTVGPYANEFGVWSPDARQIAFESSENGVVGWDPLIFVMNSDGTNRHSLGVRGYASGWSRDNTRILYTGCPLCEGGGDLSEHIYVVNADGSGAHQLTQNPSGVQVFDQGPIFSAGGEAIFFRSNRFDPSQLQADLYVMKADGTNLVRFTNYAPGGNAGIPDLSQEGKTLAFVSQQPGKSTLGIYAMETDASNFHLIIESTATEIYSGPRWSPGGGQLVVTSTPTGQTTINYLCIVNVSGSGLRTLIPDQIEGLPDWSW